MSKDLVNVITIKSPIDPRTGFLSNSSNYGFTLGDKYWPTVEHYILASRFRGTLYEDKIRGQLTVTAARLAASRYSRYARPGETIDNAEFEEILREKFSQNPLLQRRLQDTGYAKILDPDNASLGPILEKIRNKELVIPTPSAVPSADKYKDISTSTLTNQEKTIVEGAIILSQRVAKSEGFKQIHSEMVEDALSNLTKTKKEAASLIKYTAGWVDDAHWGEVFTFMPNYDKLTKDINRMLTKKDSSHAHQIRASAIISSLIRWYRDKANKYERKYLLDTLSNAKTMDFTIPPKHRWYRNEEPQILPSKKPIKKSVKRSVKKKSPKKSLKETRLSKSSAILEIVDTNKGFYVIGKDLEKHSATLLALGGKYPKNGESIEFRNREAYEEVEELIISILPEKEKLQAMHRRWLKEKLILFLDTASRIAGKKTITEDILKKTLLTYSCQIDNITLPKSKKYEDILDQILAQQKKSISDDARVFLLGWTAFMSDTLLSTLTDNNNVSEYIKNLEKIERSVSKEKCGIVKGISDEQVCIVKSIMHLSENAKDIDMIIWAFLTLHPRKGRVSAEQYMKNVKKIVDMNSSLADIGVKIDIESIDKILSVVYPKVNVDKKAKVLIAASVAFFALLLKKGNSKLLLRIKVLQGTN